MINESIQNRIRGLIQCVRTQPETQEVVTKYILEIVQAYQEAIQETSDNMVVLQEHLSEMMAADITEMVASKFIEKKGMQEEFRAFVEGELSEDLNAYVTGLIQ